MRCFQLACVFFALLARSGAIAPSQPLAVVLTVVSPTLLKLTFRPADSSASGFLAEFDSTPSFDSSSYIAEYVVTVDPVLRYWGTGGHVYARISAINADGPSSYSMPSPPYVDLTDHSDSSWYDPPTIYYVTAGIMTVIILIFLFVRIRRNWKARVAGLPVYSATEMSTSGTSNSIDQRVIGKAAAPEDDFELEMDEEDEVAPLTVGRTTNAPVAHDSVWFQSEWERIQRTQTFECHVVQHIMLHTDTLERLVDRCHYTLVASGQPETGVLKLYFFAEHGMTDRNSDNWSSLNGVTSHVILAEVVVDTRARTLTATFKCDTATSKLVKSFIKSFEHAFSSIIETNAADPPVF